MKTNNQKIVLVTKETAAYLIAWIIKNPTMAALFAAVGWGIYINEIIIPRKDKLIEELSNRPPTIVTNTIIDTVYKEKIKRVTKVDTVWMGTKDTLGISTWAVAFSDTILAGHVTGKHSQFNVFDVGVNYSFLKPITSSTTTVVERYTDTLRVPSSKNFRVQAGMFIGGGPLAFGLGPEIGILTKRDDNYTYRYNLVDRTHWISYKRTIRLRGK